MPIIVKDFMWKQNVDRISIQVPLHGVPSSRADIFTSAQYIKSTFGSYFFEALLCNPIDVSQSSCTKSSSYILFDLKKCSDSEWHSLEIGTISKEERNALKMKFIKEEHDRIKKRGEERISKKAELKRVAINEQIQLDTKIRNQIEDIKKQEEAKALGDLDEWKKNVEVTRQKVEPKIKEIEDYEDEFEESACSTRKQTRAKPASKPTFGKRASEVNAVPKPRSARSLQILFTPREFPTPSRESRLEEENEFLSKQAEARRSVGFVSEDLRPEEKNPQYLLAKGKEFMKNSNYLGAVSAFSFGIKLSPKFVDLYLARSEAHIKLGNFNRVAEDCSSALNLLKPALPINLKERAICTGRRGVALFKLGFLKQGLSELEASIKLDDASGFTSILEEFKLEYDDIQAKKGNDGGGRGGGEDNTGNK